MIGFDRIEFYHEVRIIAALEDVNIARVLGMCSREEPKCIVYEYLEHGDLRTFLASHVHAEGSRTLPVSAVQAAGVKTLRWEIDTEKPNSDNIIRLFSLFFLQF